MKLLALLLIPLAFGGNRVGNGGNVVVCADSIQLLDFYEMDEAPLLRGGEHGAIVEDRLNILAKVAPKLADQYRRRAKTIGEEIDFKKDVALADVGDSLHAFTPGSPDCKVKQIAIRQDVPAGKKRFVFDKVLWDKLDAQNRAGLIMHEIIYEHFSKLGASDSRKARRMNAHLFSPAIEKAETGKFWKFVGSLELPLYP